MKTILRLSAAIALAYSGSASATLVDVSYSGTTTLTSGLAPVGSAVSVHYQFHSDITPISQLGDASYLLDPNGLVSITVGNKTFTDTNVFVEIDRSGGQIYNVNVGTRSTADLLPIPSTITFGPSSFTSTISNIAFTGSDFSTLAAPANYAAASFAIYDRIGHAGAADEEIEVALSQPGAQAAAAPEPVTWAMMVIGFGAVASGMRRRRAAASRANPLAA